MFTTGFAEIVLIVADVTAAARSYRDVVGLEPGKAAGDEWTWFLAGDAGRVQRLALHRGTPRFEEHSPLQAGARWGRVRHALLVPVDRLDAAVTPQRERGATAYGPMRLDWMHALPYYFHDPDGNLLEFFAPQSMA